MADEREPTRQSKRSFAPTPGKLAYGDTLGKSLKLMDEYKGVKLYIRINNDPDWLAVFGEVSVTGTRAEVIAAIDGKALPTGPQAPQHLKTTPRE